MKIKLILLLVCLASAVPACSVYDNRDVRTENQNANSAKKEMAKTDNKFGANLPVNPANSAGENKTARESVNPRAGETANSRLKNPCLTATLAGRKIYSAQTFPVDFEPFRDSCFVTFADPEQMVDEKDLPRGSEFHIFKDNKSVFKFPDAFDNQTGCWVTAVAFEDLNNDSLTDVVIAGKCLGAKDSYPQNMIYANSGDSFTTSAEANQRLEKFEKIKDIEDFARRNQHLFF